MSAAIANPTIAAIVADVAAASGVVARDLIGQSRLASIARMRMAACWVARSGTSLSLTEIGRAIGGRDHTTILGAVRRAEEFRRADPAFLSLTDRLLALAEQRAELTRLLADERFGSIEIRERGRFYLSRLIGPARSAALDAGYALTLQPGDGRLGLVAVPWAADLVTPAELLAIIRAQAAGILGGEPWLSIDEGPLPIAEAHGRLRWPIQLGGGVTIDLSIIPAWKAAA